MTGWALEAMAASGFLMLLVLLVRRRVSAAFGPRIAYLLWLLPVARLVLPRLPFGGSLRVALPGLDLAAPAAPLPAFDRIAVDSIPLAAPLPLAAPAPADWPMLVIAIWLGGAAMHFLWQIGLYHRFLTVVLRGSTLLCRRCGIAVLQGPGVPGPAAIGIVRRRILLPADFAERYSPAERRLVLAHEVAHHVRGDIVANGAALAVLSLHWFNPLAHRAYRAFRADQELACDATVLDAEPAASRHTYGAAVIKSATVTPAAVCALGSVTMLKGRLKMMRMPMQSRSRRIAGALLACAAIAGGLAVTASGSVAAISTRAPEHLTAPALGASGADAPRSQTTLVRAEDERSALQPASGTRVGHRHPPVTPEPPRPPTPPVTRGRASLVDPAPPPPPPPPPSTYQPVDVAPPPPPEPPVPPRHAGRDARDEAAAEAEHASAMAAHEAAIAAHRAIVAARIQHDVQRAMADVRRQGAAGCSGSGRDCIDLAAVNAQARRALLQAREGLRLADLSESSRDRALAAIDRAIARRDRAAP